MGSRRQGAAGCPSACRGGALRWRLHGAQVAYKAFERRRLLASEKARAAAAAAGAQGLDGPAGPLAAGKPKSLVLKPCWHRVPRADVALLCVCAGNKADGFRFVQWSFWTEPDPAAASGAAGGGEEAGTGDGTRQQRRVAGLAAAAARTLRMWHSNGGRVRRPVAGLLTTSDGAAPLA